VTTTTISGAGRPAISAKILGISSFDAGVNASLFSTK
jgi:hypothetical protein